MIKQWLKYYKWRLLNPIIPCAICTVPGSLPVCRDCIAELETNYLPYCSYCARTGLNLCNSCMDNPPAFSYTYCNYTYSTPLNKMLHQLKYKSDKRNIWALGYLFAHVLSGVKADTDFILPMPLSTDRLKHRGFNQVEELLCYYQIAFSYLPVKTNIAYKIVDTPHQTSLSLSARKQIHNVYQINKNVKGKNILIVDDVITTGSTANNLATALKAAGASRIELCVLLRTV